MTAPDIPRPTLDEAWAEAEAALPETGHEGFALEVGGYGDHEKGRFYHAMVGADPKLTGSGPTPSEALVNLAAKLRYLAGDER